MVKGNSKASTPSVVISAPQGHSGKTVISIGLCAAFRQRGFRVQPFKKGPDYIDSSWLTAASGRACRNLDSILMSERALLASFQQACLEADLAIIEGAMGLYDGFESGERGSTAQIARLLRSPVILVVNANHMTQSVAAMVSGYQHFQPEPHIAGGILNNVSGSRHELKLVGAIERYCGIPVVGSVPKDPSLSISERHLGLIPYREVEESYIVNRLCRCLEENLNLDAILEIARCAKTGYVDEIPIPERKAPVVNLGVIFDNVFTFYYPENVEALNRAGAELVFINSLRDKELPDIDGLYIGGGFPEMFLEELEANKQLRQHIAQAIEDYLPVYAECAGLMYLCRGIQWRGERHEMVGVIPSEVEIYPKPQGHGYVLLETTKDNPLFPVGLRVWGHEFHYSRLSQPNGFKFAYRVQRGHGINGSADGIVYKNTFATYTHLHALGVPQWADAFVAMALRARKHRCALSASQS